MIDSELVTILAIEIGSVNTRAIYFNEAAGQYHYIADGIAPTTIQPPHQNFNDGLYEAIKQVQINSGASLLDEEGHLIIPAQLDGVGVDRLVVTFSACPEIRIVTLGLLKEFSLQAAQELATSTYGKVVEQLTSSELRTSEQQMNAILQSDPDLFIFAGGIENGATRAMEKSVSMLQNLIKILPAEKTPRILYVGNSALMNRIEEIFKNDAEVHLTHNITPNLNQKRLSPARDALAKITTEIEDTSVQGFQDLASITSAPILPSCHAFSRMIHFLGKLYEPTKGVLGIDLGASWSTLTASNGDQQTIQVLPYGLGKGIGNLLRDSDLEDILRWLPSDIPRDAVRDYLHQKTLFPGTLPSTSTILEIESAVARTILNVGIRELLKKWHVEFVAFEPILAGGSILSSAATPLQVLLVLLDGLQPIGVTTFIQDSHHLTSSLGASAPLNPYLPVQVLESSAYSHLGAVISPVAFEKPGTTIMKAFVEFPDGSSSQLEVKQGSIYTLPVPVGQTVTVQCQPVRQVLLDPFKAVAGFRVLGGICGVIIDARGRPLELPADDNQRRDLLKKWATGNG